MCIFGNNKNKIAAIVIGDSHSSATVNAVVAATPNERGGILFLGADGCAAMMNISTPYFFNCGEYNKKIITYLESNLIGTPIILINHITQNLLTPNNSEIKRSFYLDNIPNTSPAFSEKFKQEYQTQLCNLTLKHPVYVVQSIPGMDVNVPQTIVRSMMYKSEKIDVAITLDKYYENERGIRSFMQDAIHTCKAHELDPVKYLCNDTHCIGSINHRPLYYDDDHLSEYGNRLLIPMFRNIWASQSTTLGQN